MAGLLQDFGAMQIGQLSVNPNSANASSLDAVLQQFALSVQYSQTAGIQNAAAAQQYAVAQQTNSLQSSLIAQESQLFTAQAAAQQQVLTAQTALDGLTNPTSAQTATATQALALAKDNLTSVTAQLTNIKNALPGSTSSATFSSPLPSASTPATPSIQTPSVQPAAPGGSNFAPAFPALKQIDNQTSLLWERLIRLVSLLAEDANQEGDEISLVEFHTDPTSGGARRKHQLLTTEYRLECTLNSSVRPRIVDLYPRTAAVNIADEKYKDNRFGIAALVSFFSLGVNAAYNREHLQITQALGESAYITGFGIQRSDFGWVFGPSLGDDSVSGGDRDTFALVAAPRGCGTAQLGLVNAVWEKEPAVKNPLATDVVPGLDYSWPLVVANNQAPADQPLKSISYTPADYDTPTPTPPAPAAAPPTPTVILDIELGDGQRIDSQASLSANGYPLKRSLDNFLRATVAASGSNVPVSGGLLQDYTGLVPNTWIPISQTELVVTLNAPQFNGPFPSLLLHSPSGVFDVTGHVRPGTKITVAGITVDCVQSSLGEPCVQSLPPVGHLRATVSQQIVAQTWPDAKQILITALNTTGQQSSGTPVGASTPTVQLITSSGRQPWSSAARVLALLPGKAVYLPCNADGERLRCRTDLTGTGPAAVDLSNGLTLQVTDTAYSGLSSGVATSVTGTFKLPACSNECGNPHIWQVSQPKWDSLHGTWRLNLSLINVKTGYQAQLGELPSATLECPSDNTTPCDLVVLIDLGSFDRVLDWMSLKVTPPGGQLLSGGKIENLRTTIAPVIKTISTDQRQFTGQNLIFDKISVGPAGTPIDLQCSAQSDCYISAFGAKDEGYLYFRPPSGKMSASGLPIAFILSNNGSLQPVPAHHPSNQPANAVAPPPPARATPAPPAAAPFPKGVIDLQNLQEIQKSLQGVIAVQ